MACMKYFLILSVLLVFNTVWAEIYKYKNSDGKWVFTDKPPLTQVDVKTIEYKDTRKILPQPRLSIYEKDNLTITEAINPYYAPVQFRIYSKEFLGGQQDILVPSNSRQPIFNRSSDAQSYRYTYRIGDPAALHNNDILYQIPILSKLKHKFSQSFNGRFSHHSEPNVYAVDIAVPVGTHIIAAREGTVIKVKDDYHMSGRSRYFLDKANHVYVLHDDGTYAVYAHLLQGSVAVTPGDKVKIGDILGRSGSSGFSTGPHLHFVIRRNVGMRTVSIPFMFVDNDGVPFEPKARMLIQPKD